MWVGRIRPLEPAQNDNNEACLVVRDDNSVQPINIKLFINDMEVIGLCDSGASTSVLSRQMFDQMADVPVERNRKLLNTAGQKQDIEAILVGPLNIRVHNSILFRKMYVADMFSLYI